MLRQKEFQRGSHVFPAVLLLQNSCRTLCVDPVLPSAREPSGRGAGTRAWIILRGVRSMFLIEATQWLLIVEEVWFLASAWGVNACRFKKKKVRNKKRSNGGCRWWTSVINCWHIQAVPSPWDSRYWNQHPSDSSAGKLVAKGRWMIGSFYQDTFDECFYYMCFIHFLSVALLTGASVRGRRYDYIITIIISVETIQ